MWRELCGERLQLANNHTSELEAEAPPMPYSRQDHNTNQKLDRNLMRNLEPEVSD